MCVVLRGALGLLPCCDCAARLLHCVSWYELIRVGESESVKTIKVTDGDHDRLALLSRAWKLPEGEVVRRLLDEFAGATTSAAGAFREEGDRVAIYADYEGHLIEAVFHRKTKRVDITSGVLAGCSYRSPSGAAAGVVKMINANVNPNRNGWLFWFLQGSRDMLQTVRSD